MKTCYVLFGLIHTERPGPLTIRECYEWADGSITTVPHPQQNKIDREFFTALHRIYPSREAAVTGGQKIITDFVAELERLKETLNGPDAKGPVSP